MITCQSASDSTPVHKGAAGATLRRCPRRGQALAWPCTEAGLQRQGKPALGRPRPLGPRRLQGASPGIWPRPQPGGKPRGRRALSIGGKVGRPPPAGASPPPRPQPARRLGRPPSQQTGTVEARSRLAVAGRSSEADLGGRGRGESGSALARDPVRLGRRVDGRGSTKRTTWRVGASCALELNGH